ncbi:MAG TPA: methyltransferase domain-containing protein [Solirubrobacteraceae bacterium]|nr:methyltransferase domain-containing protein [Solirubrobacteraceae bacterium]
MADDGYVMADTDATRESQRLGLLEANRDPGTIVRLERLGVAPGWRCLEVGAGRGSIARWLADRVGPAGSVLAADIDPRFLTGMPANVHVRRFDVREDEPEADAYDLVHCRALLMHLHDPAPALARLARSLRPGGVLLAEEGDFGMYHYGNHPHGEELTETAHDAFKVMTRAGIMNAYFGRRLPALLADCGLELEGAEVDTAIASPGDPAYEFTQASALDALPRLIAAGIMPEASGRRLEGYFGRPRTVITCASLVAAWGRAPR